MKKVLLTLTLLIPFLFPVKAQVSCSPNIDFELGNYSGWHYYTGSCCPLTTPTYSGYGTPDTSRITLMGGFGTDPCCSFPVAPTGAGVGFYTLRIGNSSSTSGSSHAQKARHYIHVPSGSAGYRYIFRNAVVLQDGGHALSLQPRLEVRAFDSATGTALPCTNYDITPVSSAGTYSVTSCGATPVMCRAWTTNSIDLSAYAGTVVGLDFATSDCGAGDGHWGYAYIDLSCGFSTSTTSPTCYSPTVTMFAPAGFAYYSWYDAATFAPVLGTLQTLTVPNPAVPTTYACVLYPYPGYGCADTFYTYVLPLPSSFTSGIVNATASTACITSSVTFTYTGGGLPLLVQWESSPDSISWTPISGATSATYTIPGIASTTYFRCVSSCPAASYSFTTPGKKITYASCCPGCELLPVRFWDDVNADCVKQSTETGNPVPVLVKVDSNSVPIDTVSVTSGLNYPAYGPAGTIYKFTVLNGGAMYYSCPLVGAVSDTIQSTPSFPYPIREAALVCSSTSAGDVGVSVSTRSMSLLQFGDVFAYYSCLTGGMDVKAYIDSQYLNTSYSIVGNPTPTSIVGNTVTWHVTSPPSNPMKFQYSILRLGPGLSIGDTVLTPATSQPITGTDVDTTNNLDVELDTIRIAFDPNYIEVDPAGCFDTDTQFQYTIHFENLGNDTAHNVYILDTLSSHLDPSTLRIVTATADMNISVFTQGGLKIAKFDFPNINLQDSSQHGLNDGAVIYKIKNKPGMPLGADIAARAGIYFDDNEVAMTNTEHNVKGCPVINKVNSLARNAKVEVFPNPAKDELIIKSEAGVYKSFSITNTVGQVMIQQDLASPVRMVNIRLLPAGMYYVSIQADGFSTMLKFIKN